jgi:hypothetical protein
VPFVSCALSWWYLIGGMDYMVYLIGGISLVGTIRGRGGGGGGGLGARAFNSVMYAVVNMFIPARRFNKNVRRAHILEHTLLLLWRRAGAVPSTLSSIHLLICL